MVGLPLYYYYCLLCNVLFVSFLNACDQLWVQYVSSVIFFVLELGGQLGDRSGFG
jgi:hypothetical protein